MRFFLPLLLSSGCGGSEPERDAPVPTDSTMIAVDLCLPPPLDAPVVPRVEGTREEFDGYATWWHVPEQPVALYWFFHGSKGNFEQINGVEVTYLLNLLTAQGYAAVSTNSTEREQAEWDKSSTDPSENPELARLIALREHLIATTALTADTPIVLSGFSDGGSMATWLSAVADELGWDIRVVSIHNSPAADFPGAIEAPTFWAVSDNDNGNVKGGAERLADLQEKDLGWPSRYLVAPEIRLTPTRFERQPEIGATLSSGFFDELVGLELIDAAGARLVTDDLSQGSAMDEIARYVESNVDSSLAWLAATQLRIVWATHRYNGYHAEEECRFYSRFIE